MSGIYIPDMEMPTRCLACQLNYDSCACILTGSRYYKYGVEFDPGEERLPDCPLVPVPPHGRLIEEKAIKNKADRLRAMTDEEIEDWYWWMHKEMMRFTDSRIFVHDWLKSPVEGEAT